MREPPYLIIIVGIILLTVAFSMAESYAKLIFGGSNLRMSPEPLISSQGTTLP